MNTRDVIPHDTAAELLPWLVNDSLPDDEKRQVLAHARSCVTCRKDLAELESLRDTIAHDAHAGDAPPIDMRNINRRIDEDMEKRRRVPRLLEAIVDFLRDPWRAAAVAQSVVIAALLIAMFVQGVDRPRYQTLTSDTSLPPGQYLRLVVDAATETGELAELLARFDLTIVDGPTERGVATAAFAKSAGRDERLEALQRLSEHPMLRYVQPVKIPVR